MSGDILVLTTGGELPASPVYRPEMLPNILQGTQQPLTPRSYLAPRASSARSRNCDSTRCETPTVASAKERYAGPRALPGTDPGQKGQKSGAAVKM